MPKTTPLAEQLKQRARAENRLIQKEMQAQLSALHSALNSMLQKELATIRTDIEKQGRCLSWRLIRSRFLSPFLIALGLCLGISAGSWALTHYLSSRIMTMEQTVHILETRGGTIQFSQCGGRLCARIDETAPEYQQGYRILERS